MYKVMLCFPRHPISKKLMVKEGRARFTNPSNDNITPASKKNKQKKNEDVKCTNVK